MAEIYVHDTNSSTDPNEVALSTVRRLIGVMHLLGDKVCLQIRFITLLKPVEHRRDQFFRCSVGHFSRHRTAADAVSIWHRLACLLLRESRRLERTGQPFGKHPLLEVANLYIASASVDADIDFIVVSLRAKKTFKLA
jgi:hypothetical protein